MKHFIYLILFTVLSFSSVQAQQVDNEEMKKEFEQLEQEMSRAFQELSKILGDPNRITQDSTMMNFFNFPMDDLGGQFHQMAPDSMMMGEMFDMLDQQMRAFSKEDFMQLEDLLRGFTEQLDMMPAPDVNPKEKKKKKRKTTTM